MIDKYEEISNKYKKGSQKFSSGHRSTTHAVKEIQNNDKHVLKDLESVNVIISDIDKYFAEKTGIVNKKDMIFLWSAVSLQCVRWLLIPTIKEDYLYPDSDNRKDSRSEGKKDKTWAGKKIDNEREEQGFPDKKHILILPVPFDAMKGTEDIVIPGVTEYGKNISGRNHHAATLGHDPIIGQIVGTANIMTRSITFHDSLLTTRRVVNEKGREQEVVKIPIYNNALMIKDVIQSSKEDVNRITAALIKENLHLQSDKYTKVGLPIPFLSARLQQELLTRKWNNKELEDVLIGGLKGTALNFLVALIINTIVGSLHGFCYNKQDDGDLNFYNVRTRRIVATSNIIAESINVAAVLAGSIVGVLSENSDLVKKSISHVDIGGYIEAIHQVCKQQKLQEEIRREFLEKELYNCFVNDKYSFLEESRYE